MNLHSSKGTELLATEALYALFAVDYRLFVLHNDGLRGADLLAFLTSLTFLALDGGLGFKHASGDLAKKL